MKAISLWQPWASAMALGMKKIETRHWPTCYRGPLLIHAAKKIIQWPSIDIQSLFDGIAFQPSDLPRGVLLCRVDLVDCKMIFLHNRPEGIERILGNYDRALVLLEKIWESAVEDENYGSQRGVLFDMGLTYLRMKSIDEAEKVADKLKEIIEEGISKRFLRHYLHLMGMIEFERENFYEAIDYFEKALSLHPYQHRWNVPPETHAQFIDALALSISPAL